MDRLPLVRILLLPSLSGGVLVLLVSAGIILADIWPTVRYTTSLNAYLVGQYSAKTLLLQSRDHFSLLRLALHGSLVYYVMVAVGGISISLIVYAILEATGWARHSADDAIQGLHQGRQKQELLRRQALRIFCIVTWGIYTLFFVNIMTPFSLSLAENATNAPAVLSRIGSMAAAGAVLMVGLQLHVIFARLSLLRIRIFGGSDVVEEYGR